jgi:hypothetical protein
MAFGYAYDVIASDLVRLAPGGHDIGIVVGQNGYNINALLLELGEGLNVAGNVASGANRSEGTFAITDLSVLWKMEPGWNFPLWNVPGRAKMTTFLSAHSLEA